MSVQRVFLDWSQPALVSALAYLADRFATPDALDLANVVVAVPASRAGRRLLELLVGWSEEHHRPLHPPRIVTLGGLPERLYQAKRPFAGELVQQLAWKEALHASGPGQIARLMPALPRPGDLTAWLELGALLARLHRELAADGLDFHDVAQRGPAIPGFRETDRWEALAAIQRRYLEVLDDLGLWDLQTARLFAIRHRETALDGPLVLVGTVDLNRSQRLMLDQVADRVTALVFAPESLADRFDGHGCLRPPRWLDVVVDLRDDQIEVVDTPADQAAAVIQALSELDGRYAAEEITIGVPDERLVPYIAQRLEHRGTPARYGPGRSVAQSSPYRLLAALAEYLEGKTFTAFASLVRHPAIEAWLTRQGVRGDGLTALDEYHNRHLPHRAGVLPGSPGPGEPPPEAASRTGGDRLADLVAAVHRAIGSLAGRFGGPDRPLDEWAGPIVDLLVTCFGHRPLDSTRPAEREIVGACQTIRGTLEGFGQIPSDLIPAVDGPTAIRLALRQAAQATIPPPADREAIEMLGWLELPWDDAPVLVVAGLNEGIVPGSRSADLFLPNRLRQALEIEDNNRRYARDAYALSLLAASRDSLTLIAGRRTPEGDPLWPSRLLFACRPQKTVDRVLRFVMARPAAATRAAPARGPARAGGRSRLEVPKPVPLSRPVTSMTVTEFRDYLACPYRYYLRHQMGLEGLDDSATELDRAAFGSLVHAVLDQFGKGPAAETTDVEEILEQINAALDQQVRRRYGQAVRAPVRVQIEQARARLRVFARWQADWARQGWRIEMAERRVGQGDAALVVDGQPMFLRGRIDRVDFHPGTGRRIIFDYKTSDTAKDPGKTHRQGETWTDLQLPLYRHLAAGLGLDGPLELGYIVLPKDTTQVGERLAEWTPDDLTDADRTAEEVIRNVRAERFWPPQSPPPPWFDDLAAICQDTQFSAVPSEEQE